MDVFEKCEDPTQTIKFGADIKYPSNTYYPPGTVCARDFTVHSCFTTGDSGAPLMVEDTSDDRLYVEGLLSFTKGCEGRNTILNENPATYTKLSCFLPWVAEQHGISYDGDPTTDQSCRTGQGSRTTNKVCRAIKGFTTEKECIFPFYFMGKRYDQCILMFAEFFLYPTFMCPLYSITSHIDGINNYEKMEYCSEAEQTDGTFDPSKCNGKEGRLTPFYTCKNDCPGGYKNLLFISSPQCRVWESLAVGRSC